ncbi:MAG: outer membrane beta-barrel protein [Bacteroidales bacterium]|nr:outer membrane beta-barrel protein [Bacteroidales bacterium]
MKKLFSIIMLCMVCTIAAHSQITITYDMIRTPESEVRIRLLDSLNNVPLVMASVYLQPKGDTTIMYFNLTDTSGTAVLENVVRGNYRLTAEYLGYRPFVKEFYFSKSKEELGTVNMIEDATLLEAATVTAMGNAIEVKQDTIVYNASMFRTADNAVLGELLKKMPGFEVSSSGQVTINGESVSKITVNGRTFFFDDPSMAVKNLPAKIVDKIKITDLKSENEKGTGISDMTAQKQKEMDISLKKEYEKGWFGNAKMAAGAPISPESDDPNMLVGGKDFMYNGNLMLSGYNDKDQVTIIANASNTPNTGAGDMIMVMVGGEDTGPATRIRPRNGLTTSLQAGANLNTSRIKGLNTTVMANYKGNLIESESATQRITFMDDTPDMNRSSRLVDNYDENLANISLELANQDKKKYTLRIVPKINFTRLERKTYNDMETWQGAAGAATGEMLNTSSARSYLESDYFMHRTDAYITLKDLGKKGRNLSFEAGWFLSNDDSQSKEYSLTTYSAEGSTLNDLYYQGETRGYGGRLYLTYVEPVGKQWNISTSLKSYINRNDVTNDAFSRPGEGKFTAGFADRREYSVYDDYYSSVSEYRYFKNSAELLAQYRKGKTTIQFGGQVEAVNNENYSKSYGISQTTGKGEYLWNFSPFLRINNTAESGFFYMVRYSGSSSALGNSQITPAPDISNPTFIKIGNVWLEPEFRNSLTLSTNYNNKKNFSYFSGYLFLDNTQRSIVYANWFDSEGVQYNIPVNSRKSRNDIRVSGSISSLPLNEGKSLLLGGSIYSNFSISYSYQNMNRSGALDMENFNYSDFMKQFWGNASGDRFYSGASGFKESRTSSTSLSGTVSLRYKGERLNSRIYLSTDRRIVKYSLNKDANMNTWDHSIYAEAEYDTKNKFNFITSMQYRFYEGYTNGYGEPAFKWDFEAYKTIKAVTFGIKVKDILNQTTSFTRTTSAGYIEDSYRNVIGRHFLVSLTWNFGKMNSGKNRSATNAMFNMMM